jgi:hypothetical protein
VCEVMSPGSPIAYMCCRLTRTSVHLASLAMIYHNAHLHVALLLNRTLTWTWRQRTSSRAATPTPGSGALLSSWCSHSSPLPTSWSRRCVARFGSCIQHASLSGSQHVQSAWRARVRTLAWLSATAQVLGWRGGCRCLSVGECRHRKTDSGTARGRRRHCAGGVRVQRQVCRGAGDGRQGKGRHPVPGVQARGEPRIDARRWSVRPQTRSATFESVPWLLCRATSSGRCCWTM